MSRHRFMITMRLTNLRPKLNDIIPANPNQPYDIREIITEVVDGDSFFEVHKDYAENIVVGFARIGGRSIGVVANQPAVLAGVLDINSSKENGALCALLRLL